MILLFVLSYRIFFELNNRSYSWYGYDSLMMYNYTSSSLVIKKTMETSFHDIVGAQCISCEWSLTLTFIIHRFNKKRWNIKSQKTRICIYFVLRLALVSISSNSCGAISRECLIPITDRRESYIWITSYTVC